MPPCFYILLLTAVQSRAVADAVVATFDSSFVRDQMALFKALCGGWNDAVRQSQR